MRWRGRQRRRQLTLDWNRYLAEVPRLADSGLYQRGMNLTTDLEPFAGVNFLGYPSGGFIRRGAEELGWGFGSQVAVGDEFLPAFQVKPDLGLNLPRLFDRHRPEVIVDFGTAFGASALLYFQLASRYTTAPQVLSIDIEDARTGGAGDVHRRVQSEQLVQFLVTDSLGDEALEAVTQIVASNAGRRVLFSFDDDHTAEHVYAELRRYAPLLTSGDVLLVQDTWDQGLHGHAGSPLLAVLRFLDENNDFRVDTEYFEDVELPCNFVHAVLVKQ